MVPLAWTPSGIAERALLSGGRTSLEAGLDGSHCEHIIPAASPANSSPSRPGICPVSKVFLRHAAL